MQYDKPSSLNELPPAIIKTEETTTEDLSKQTNQEGCYISVSPVPKFDLSCVDLNGYLSKNGEANASGTSSTMSPSPSPEIPEDEGWSFLPADGSIPGEDMSKLAEAENKYNQQEIRIANTET